MIVTVSVITPFPGARRLRGAALPTGLHPATLYYLWDARLLMNMTTPVLEKLQGQLAAHWQRSRSARSATSYRVHYQCRAALQPNKVVIA